MAQAKFFSRRLLRLRTDDQLVASLRAGNHDALAVMHERYEPRLTAYVRRMLSAADAEDVLQDVFARAHATLSADERPVALRPWLYRVAHNRCMDVLRRPAPMPVEEPEASVATHARSAGDEAEDRETLRTIVADIEGLPAQQRSALVIRELEGLSYEDLAAALDTTVPAVKSLLVRARMNLAKAAQGREAEAQAVASPPRSGRAVAGLG